MVCLPIPILAEVDTESLIAVVVMLLYGLFWLLKRVAESKQQQQRLAEGGSSAEEEEEEVYVADEDEVKRFLEGMGVKQREPGPQRPAQPSAPGRPPTERPPQPAPAGGQYPGRSPQRPQPQPARPALVARQPQLVATARPAPPPKPKPAATQARRPEPAPAQEEYTFGGEMHGVKVTKKPPPELLAAGTPGRLAPAERQGAAARQPAEERFEFPALSPLQRAVVFAEILDRKRGPHNFLSR